MYIEEVLEEIHVVKAYVVVVRVKPTVRVCALKDS